MNGTGSGFPARQTGWEKKRARKSEPRSLTRRSRKPKAENRTPAQSWARSGRRARRGAGPAGRARLRAPLLSHSPPPLPGPRAPRCGLAPELYKVGTGSTASSLCRFCLNEQRAGDAQIARAARAGRPREAADGRVLNHKKSFPVTNSFVGRCQRYSCFCLSLNTFQQFGQ